MKKKISGGSKTEFLLKMTKKIKGKTLTQACLIYPQWAFRATIIDGKSVIVAKNILYTRINVELKGGKIVRIINIG
jgi:hypothetical protein